MLNKNVCVYAAIFTFFMASVAGAQPMAPSISQQPSPQNYIASLSNMLTESQVREAQARAQIAALQDRVSSLERQLSAATEQAAAATAAKKPEDSTVPK